MCYEGLGREGLLKESGTLPFLHKLNNDCREHRFLKSPKERLVISLYVKKMLILKSSYIQYTPSPIRLDV